MGDPPGVKKKKRKTKKKTKDLVGDRLNKLSYTGQIIRPEKKKKKSRRTKKKYGIWVWMHKGELVKQWRDELNGRGTEKTSEETRGGEDSSGEGREDTE